MRLRIPFVSARLNRLLDWIAIERFLFKYADMISSVTRDRSYNDDVRDALKRYKDEWITLLPRRYEFILRELVREGIMPERELQSYLDCSRNSLFGGEGFDYIKNEATGELIEIEVPVRPIPWVEYPEVFMKMSPSLFRLITELEKDIKVVRSHERGYLAASMSIPFVPKK